MWLICKVLIEFVTISLLFYVFVFWLQGMWDLNSLTRDQPRTSALKGKVLTTGPPGKSLDIFSFFFFLRGGTVSYVLMSYLEGALEYFRYLLQDESSLNACLIDYLTSNDAFYL